MSNRLKNTVSPYLLQHAENPVEWYPWSEEAFDRARAEDKPIFLSIGYSTCHWCHVMAHESFENPETARILNQHFICIKVDREERPDIDSVYMTVCQALTGSGGWPMSIFMTWDKQPFFVGTYFPSKVFTDLLYRIAAVWHENRNDILQSANSITAHLRQTEQTVSSGNTANLIEQAVQFFRQSFDAQYGGFGDAPKFPAAHNLLFLLLYAKQIGDQNVLQMVEKTLLQLRLGGIFDQIGGGFSRYSTDRYFLAPHFEKMLYDNALLIMAYAAAYSLTDNALYLETASNTADYVLREMTAPEGGFYSAQDADSDGEEGKFYTFTLTEILDMLGQDTGTRFAELYDISDKGNFDGKNIPNLLKTGTVPHDLDDALHQLYEYRKHRIKLHTDDKILLSWNAMMIAALSILYRVSHQQKHLDAAENARDFLLKNLGDGKRIFGTWRNGVRSDTAFLDDYAYFTAGLIELYNITLDAHNLELAEQFCDETVHRFTDSEHGGFTLSKQGSSELFLNPKETYDNAMPSGNSVMAYNFVRLYQLTEKEKYQELAEQQIQFLSAQAQDIPAGHCFFLLTKLLHENPPPHIVIVPKKADDLYKISLPFLANCVIQRESESYPPINGRTTFYICRNKMCLPPCNDLTI